MKKTYTNNIIIQSYYNRFCADRVFVRNNAKAYLFIYLFDLRSNRVRVLNNNSMRMKRT